MDRPAPGPSGGEPPRWDPTRPPRIPGGTVPPGPPSGGTGPQAPPQADPYRPAPNTGEEYTVPADPTPTEPIPRLPPAGHAGYEGEWSDWVARTDADTDATGHTRPATPHPAQDARSGPDPLPEPPPHPDDSGPAETNAVPEPEAPTTARERLRRRLAPTADTTPPPVRAARGPARNRVLPVLLGTAGAAALAAAAYVQFAVIGGDEASPPVAAAPATTASAAPTADPHCPAERTGSTVQGNGSGGTDSGPDAIFGFQHAYYVARSGEQARALVAPDAAVPPAPDIQRGIDTIPAGTTHCVRITPGAFVGQYTVVVTEHRPGSAPLAYNPQLVTTIRIGNRTLITGIGPMP